MNELNIAQRIRSISEWLDSKVEIGSSSFDLAPGPVSQFDFELSEAAHGLMLIAADLDRAALAAQPGAVPAKNNDVDQLLRAVFELCEATEEAPEVEPKNEHQRGFDKGRRFEAKAIRRAVGDWFQATFCGQSFMGEPVVPAVMGKSLLRPAGAKPTMCYCPPGVCQAPKPQWCINNRECDQVAPTEAKPAQDAVDAELLDWLEAQINEHGAIHLHDGNNPNGHGLGLRPGSLNRTLRDAIRAAISAKKGGA